MGLVGPPPLVLAEVREETGSRPGSAFRESEVRGQGHLHLSGVSVLMDMLGWPTCRATQPPVSPKPLGSGMQVQLTGWGLCSPAGLGRVPPAQVHPIPGAEQWETSLHPQALQRLPPLPAASSHLGAARSPFLTTPGPSSGTSSYITSSQVAV